MKRWLMVLLCLAIPLQGLASVRLAAAHCPMQAQMQAQSAASVVMTAADEKPADCCNDDAVAKNGQACKAGLDCSAPALALASVEPSPVATASSARPGSGSVVGYLGGRLATVWRPPARR